MTLSATLALRPDAERVRLRLGTAFVEHVDDLWPQGEPAATPEWIRANVDDILAALEVMFAIGPQGRASNLRRIPHRMHWLLWLLAELDWGQAGRWLPELPTREDRKSTRLNSSH